MYSKVLNIKVNQLIFNHLSANIVHAQHDADVVRFKENSTYKLPS